MACEDGRMEQIRSVLSTLTTRSLPFIGEDTPLKEAGFDSLDMVQLLMFLEARLQVSFPEGAESKIATFGDLARLLPRDEA